MNGLRQAALTFLNVVWILRKTAKFINFCSDRGWGLVYSSSPAPSTYHLSLSIILGYRGLQGVPKQT